MTASQPLAGHDGRERQEKEAAPSAALVVIGDEILSGRTQDRNIATIALWLGARGITLAEVRILPDEEDAIIAAVRALKQAVDYLFTTGGIGPTHDDITAESIAKALGRELVVHEEAYRRLLAYYGPDRFTPARQRMARTPAGAELIDNPISIAPGFRVENVFVLAGVPEIAAAMLDSLEPMITGGPPVLSRVLDVPLPESAFADALTAIAARFQAVRIGSYPYYRDGRAGAEIVLRARDEGLLGEAVAAVCEAARKAGVAARPVRV